MGWAGGKWGGVGGGGGGGGVGLGWGWGGGGKFLWRGSVVWVFFHFRAILEEPYFLGATTEYKPVKRLGLM